jgi:hypothetical protein
LDGHRSYLSAVEALDFDADDAMQIKIFGGSESGGARTGGRYSPPKRDNPDPQYISTSYVERQNLTMRMSMRRFTRLMNAFSKKFENHCHALALYFYCYNWVRQHKALRTSPAMAAGLPDKLMDVGDLVTMIDVREVAAVSARRAILLQETV